ncbi:ribosomal protein S18-alanine N-acetyltransferase [Hazenella sp. IB182357]|uniref:Ribosomal protein S18-alanine N-acetyltransferase n=1 Tax=Polycladospora coralii TaxID=2771432 RepID=A0A926NF70_9BACL|nr:ribosomal protein S18-alanine N-acetyltransferase [Polycladospora coralii]MBD1372288.1 ribosomal protein S18-alanine N-acetyltransferase [Polycladospora coralii]
MSRRSKDKIMFRPMVLSDIPDIVKVENASFPTPWPQKAFYNELAFNQFARYTVVTCADEIIGYCGFWLILDEAHITNIAVHPDYQGCGIGEMTLIYVMEMARMSGAKRMTLEVRVSNLVAQKLYEKLGFENTGVRKAYYTDNKEDAIIMWVTLYEEQQSNSCVRY